MESSTSKNEAEILRTLRSRFEREGYTFVPHPTKDMVPAFLGGYQPDALALSDKKSLVIEIKSRRSPSGDSRLAQLAERVKAAPGWDLHIVYAGDFSRPVYGKPSRNAVVELLNEVFDLYHKDLLRPALLMGWAALEAIARSAVLEEIPRLWPNDT
ncbi:hypothetical protein [Tardiphaga robiniae]|uniref:REase AHJR-like domain-containing protein n=1 Tax=Tardiphaga robiniae TaxID=943830 RepID=A0A7G6U2C1_9BRAD|nr:hypothetical protein [Tardiphaga robiniae]QND73153.1 hypothetical protein HB776_19530 [Tardiphaga robiniae]